MLIDILEDALQEVQARDPPVNNSTQAQGPESNRLDGVVNLLSTVCMELCKFNSQNNRSSDGIVSERMARSNHTPRASTASVRSPNDDLYDTYSTQPRKRRRVDSCGNPNIDLQLPLEDLLDASSCLPAPDLLENTVNAYFNKIQPWIPILHETRFRSRMLDPDQRPLLVVIIHAMVVAAIRFARPEAHGLSAADVEAKAKRSRSIVVLNAMDSLSVENLQALIIIAFDDVSPLALYFPFHRLIVGTDR
jgi:hypothetical protein